MIDTRHLNLASKYLRQKKATEADWLEWLTDRMRSRKSFPLNEFDRLCLLFLASKVGHTFSFTVVQLLNHCHLSRKIWTKASFTPSSNLLFSAYPTESEMSKLSSSLGYTRNGGLLCYQIPPPLNAGKSANSGFKRVKRVSFVLLWISSIANRHFPKEKWIDQIKQSL